MLGLSANLLYMCLYMSRSLPHNLSLRRLLTPHQIRRSLADRLYLLLLALQRRALSPQLAAAA